MGHHDGALAELQEPGQNLFDRRLLHHHLVADARQLLDLEGNRRPGIHKGAEPVRDLPLFHADRADLNDTVILGAKTRGLDVEDHISRVQALAPGVLHDILQVVYQIALHAVNDFEGVPLVQTVAGVRIGLHHAVIRHSDGRMAPGFGPLDDILHIGDAVHIAHLRMAVELHPLDLASVHAGRTEIRRLLDAHHSSYVQLIVKAVLGREPADLHKHALGNLFLQGFQICLILREHLDMDRVGIIRHSKSDDGSAAADLPLVPAGNLAMDHHLAHLSHQLHQIDDVGIVKVPSVQHVRIITPCALKTRSRAAQMLPVGILALAVAAEGPLSASLRGRLLLLSACRLRAASLLRNARAGRPVCPAPGLALRLYACRLILRGLKLQHGFRQKGRLPVDIRPPGTLFLFSLLLHKFRMDMYVQAAAFRKDLIEDPDQLVRRVLSQGRLPKLHPHDMLLGERDLRPPEQIVLENAVMLQLPENAVLIKLQKLFRRILAGKLVALQDFKLYLRAPEELALQRPLKLKKLLLMDQLSAHKIDSYEIFRPVGGHLLHLHLAQQIQKALIQRERREDLLEHSCHRYYSSFQ